MNVFLELTLWLDSIGKRTRSKRFKLILDVCCWATLKPYRIWFNACFPDFKDPVMIEVKDYAS